MNFLVILLTLSIVVETAEQLFFKMSANEKLKHVFILLGILMYVLFAVLWFRILKDLPLGIALPIMGLNYVSVALAGKVFLKEKVSLKRWAGIALILVGQVFVSIGGARYL